jgi:3',5'-cyclic AMP phosphodiesterase CpdA
MKRKTILFGFLVMLLFAGCKKYDLKNLTEEGTATQSASKSAFLTGKDHVRIAVMSDIHYIDHSLLQGNAINGTVFQADVMNGINKASLGYSSDIFKQVLAELQTEKPDIVLIAGDMAKDGELANHNIVSQLIQDSLLSKGVKVYVTVGNHDILNTNAYSFTENFKSPVPNVTSDQFVNIYQNEGFNQAFSKDANSLSYVAAPYEKLWILSIDAVNYSTAKRYGYITPETLQWIGHLMDSANNNAITVLGLMHYNLVEHMTSQNAYMPFTVLNNSADAVNALTTAGLKVIFTGHNHTTDVTQRITDKGTIYDIETGSLVTYPTGYRIIDLKNKEMEISTNHVTSLPITIDGYRTFPDYAYNALKSNLDIFFKGALYRMFKLPQAVADSAAPYAANAYMAHMAGNEKLSPVEEQGFNAIKTTNQATKEAMTNLWTDLNMKDQKTHIKLINP